LDVYTERFELERIYYIRQLRKVHI